MGEVEHTKEIICVNFETFSVMIGLLERLFCPNKVGWISKKIDL